MMDLRYHLASLMSVFLALAVGIIVGVSLGSSERQAATIRLLQQDVAAIRSEDSRVKEVNTDLQHRLARHDEAVAQELLPLAVRGRLAGNRVALILLGDASEELRAPLSRVLHLAGADLLTLRVPDGELVPDSAARRPDDGSTGTDDPGESTRSPSAASAHGSSPSAAPSAPLFARALLAGRPALLDELRARIPALDVTGELRAPIRRFLLICPNAPPDDTHRTVGGSGWEVAFARSAREGGAILVAAEPETSLALQRAATGLTTASASRATTSVLDPLAGLGASTVDNVDTGIGQIAAVLALAGAPGNFGTGPGAALVLPPIEVGEEKRSPARSAAITHPAP